MSYTYTYGNLQEIFSVDMTDYINDFINRIGDIFSKKNPNQSLDKGSIFKQITSTASIETNKPSLVDVPLLSERYELAVRRKIQKIAEKNGIRSEFIASETPINSDAMPKTIRTPDGETIDAAMYRLTKEYTRKELLDMGMEGLDNIIEENARLLSRCSVAAKKHNNGVFFL